MTQEEIRKAIEELFVNRWTDNRIAFENVPYTPPDENRWVRLSVQILYNSYDGLGECREIFGMVGVQIYIPLRQGTLEQEQISDSIVKIFRGSYGGVTFRDINVMSDGELEGWYQSHILINFTARGN